MARILRCLHAGAAGATKAAALADLESTGYLRVDGTDSVVLLHRE
jgi:hypothetical protein